MAKKPIITTYVGVFKTNLEKRKKRIKEELDKPKKERDKNFLKKELEDIKSVRKMIKEVEKDTSKKCPHCGHVCDQ